MEGILRLRLLFQDPNILTDLQKSEGLNQSWFFFKPQQHKTISDLSSHLLHKFQLHDSCPHGINLSMDGFVLPPFESTCILKDKDIVSVNKKGGHLAIKGNNGPEMILNLQGNNGPNVVENLQIVEKQPVIGGPLLLANEEFVHGSGGYQSESEDESEEEEEAEPKDDTSHQENALVGNAVSKKRKASDTLPNSMKKKHRHDAEEKLNVQTKNLQDLVSLSDELQKNGVENIEASPKSGATKRQGPSRSARRKAKKRQWLRTMAKIKEKYAVTEPEGLRNWKELQRKAGKGEPSCQPNGQVDDKANGQLKGHQNMKQQKADAKRKEVAGQTKGPLHWKQFQGDDKIKDTNQEKHAEEKSKACGKSNQTSDTEDEVVPVEIRPGHIRFEPLGKEHVLKQSQVEVESFRWNGSMSKKKGQKWGQEKVSFSQKNDSLGLNRQHLEMANGRKQKWGQEKVSFSQKDDSLDSNKEHSDMVNGERQKWGQEKVSFSQKDDSLDSNKEHSEMVNGEKKPHFCESMDFNTLPFLCGLPKEGFVIAYRLLELSSTWTPEVSSYRVGKVSQYNSVANTVLLMPVAEFPLIFSEDESSKQPDSSIYNEDGSLEIDFSSLLEVRLVKHGTPDPAGIPGQVEHSAANESTQVLGSCNKKPGTPAAGAGEVNNGKQTQSTPLENDGASVWEQVSETLKAKKAELSRKKGSWSYRAMRGGALGPTMALLRSTNEI